jgi:hypothetical protein
VADLRTTSPTVAALNRPDGFPHAAVYGRIDRRLAWLKVLLSTRNNDESFGIYKTLYDGAVWLFRGCMVVRLFIMLRPDQAFHCFRGHQALTHIDAQWMFYTTGFKKGVDFDGLLPVSTMAYPGTTLAYATNLMVRDHNHIDITWRPDGIRAMAYQMVRRLGMEETGTTADGGGVGGGGGGGGDGCIQCFLPARPGLKAGMASGVHSAAQAGARRPTRQ